MILPAFIVHLHSNRGFIGLDIVPGEQFTPHRLGDRLQQVADPHHPAIHGGAVNLDARIAGQHGALAVKRQVIEVLNEPGQPPNEPGQPPCYRVFGWVTCDERVGRCATGVLGFVAALPVGD
jgi:hypothetical protein